MNDAPPSTSPKAAKRSRRKAAAKLLTVPATDAAAGKVPVALPADVGIEETGALRTLLADRLDDAEVTLDGSQVQRIHTSAMQLFLMFCRDRVAAGRTTVWHDPSAPLHAAARVLGLTHALQFPRELS